VIDVALLLRATRSVVMNFSLLDGSGVRRAPEGAPALS